MKRLGVYVFTSGLMFGSLLLQSDPASAWSSSSDTMAHFGKDSACTDHLVDPTTIGAYPPSQTMWLCARNSGANTWSAAIYKIALGTPLVCKLSSVSISTHSFPCNLTASGSYKGIVTYCIGNSCFNSDQDFRWTIP